MPEQLWSAEQLAILDAASRALAEMKRIEHKTMIIEQENAALKSLIRKLVSGGAQSLDPEARALFESVTGSMST